MFNLMAGKSKPVLLSFDGGALVLTCIAALAVFLRTRGLLSESVWYDEAVSYRFLNDTNPVTFLSNEWKYDPPMVPAYFLLEWLWARIFGVSVPAVRSLSILLGTFTVFVVYALGRRMSGKTAGLLSAASLAACQNHIFYSQEIRMYALFVFLVSVSMLSMIAYFGERNRVWLTVNVTVNMLLLWTHIFSFFYLFVQGLMVLFLWRKESRILIYWAVPQFVNCVAWYFLWVRFIDLDVLAHFVHVRPVLPDLVYAYWRNIGLSSLDSAELLFTSFVLSLVVFLAGWALRSRRRDGRVWFLLGVSAIPLGMFLFSMHFLSVFLARYVQYCCIPIYVLLMSGIVLHRFGRCLGVLFVALLMFNTCISERPYRENWNKIREIIPADAQTVVVPGFHEIVLECMGYREPVSTWRMSVILNEMEAFDDFWVILSFPMKNCDVSDALLRKHFTIVEDESIVRSRSGLLELKVLHCMKQPSSTINGDRLFNSL